MDFRVEPLGMSPGDMAVIRANLKAHRAHGSTFLMTHFSRQRRILLMLVHVEGEIIDWDMAPCESEGNIESLKEDWIQGVVRRGLLAERAAKDAAEAALNSIAKPRH